MPRTYRRRATTRRRSRYRRWWRNPASWRYARRRRTPVANKGTRGRTRIAMRSNTPLPFVIPPNTAYSAIAYLNPLVQNQTTPANKQPLAFLMGSFTSIFDIYRRLYDQVKVDRVGIKLTGVDTIGNGGQVGAIRVCMAWDRNSTQRDFFTANRIQITDIENMPGASVRMFTNNSRVQMWSSVSASDLAERSTFMDTDYATMNLSSANTGWANDQTLLTLYPFQNPYWAGFFPTCYIALALTQPNATGNAIPINMYADIYVTVTFRNPKYTQQSQAKGLGIDLTPEKTITISETGDFPITAKLDVEQPDGTIVREDTLI